MNRFHLPVFPKSTTSAVQVTYDIQLLSTIDPCNEEQTRRLEDTSAKSQTNSRAGEQLLVFTVILCNFLLSTQIEFT